MNWQHCTTTVMQLEDLVLIPPIGVLLSMTPTTIIGVRILVVGRSTTAVTIIAAVVFEIINHVNNSKNTYNKSK
jgi:hypothetical protein